MHVVVVCLDQYPVLGLTLMWGSMCDLEKRQNLERENVGQRRMVADLRTYSRRL